MLRLFKKVTLIKEGSRLEGWVKLTALATASSGTGQSEQKRESRTEPGAGCEGSRAAGVCWRPGSCSKVAGTASQPRAPGKPGALGR